MITTYKIILPHCSVQLFLHFHIFLEVMFTSATQTTMLWKKTEQNQPLFMRSCSCSVAAVESKKSLEMSEQAEFR